ncbi:MAG: hypothetical protein IKZ38_03370 [Clostridia bacterium]|jgi:hypothetical protein|nr:hypothetical protein [Clostridia bacterium]
MDELKNEQTNANGITAEAETEKDTQNGEVSLGKFKDVNALIHAYNSLQAEFTKRCQRIKELEGLATSVDKATAPTASVKEGADNAVGITDEDKKAVLKDYLKGVLSAKQTAIVMGSAGTGVKAPVRKPKTFDEAGVLAKEIFN